LNEHALSNQLALCFKHIFLQNTEAEPSELMQKSVFVDHNLKSFYYARPQEVAAGAFEAFIQHHPIKNAFLVKCKAKLGIYPSGEELAVISTQMATYFNWLGKALDHSPTDE
jgi:ABC-type uncharacterized transport system YnjBCD substrate-binding protein